MSYYIVLSFILGVVALIGVFLTVSKRRPLANKEVTPATVNPAHEGSLEPHEPRTLVIGETPDRPVVEVTVSNELEAYDRGTPIPTGNPQISRLSALMQAVPSLLVANEAAGKRLMEVVVNGDLARAADGNGLRPFVLGPKGIQEQARLFEVDKLQNLINAGAVWQIASVLVAQKHLADINASLEEIKQGIASISRFLDYQRKARIQAASDYLQQAHVALSLGELSPSVRHQLESVERDLLEIQDHLAREFEQYATEDVDDGDSFGTESITQNLIKKAQKLEELGGDMAVCLRTRILAWHVLALYPGEPHLKQARRHAIETSIGRLRELQPHIGINLTYQANSIKSFWNTKGTLEERKQQVENAANSATNAFSKRIQKGTQVLESSKQLLLENDKPMRYLFAMDGQQLLEVRAAR